MTTPINHSPDGSLQHFGRHALPTVAPALGEINDKAKAVGGEDQAAADAIGRMASHAETNIPASKSLVADLQAAAAEARAIAQAEADLVARRTKLAATAAELPRRYHREHETDEDRVNNPRGGRAAEKRADVSSAEKDT